MNPRFQVGHVRFEAFVDSDEKTSEPLADCWLYLFWYTLRGEGGWTDEIYVDDHGQYHSIDLGANSGKDVRPHSSRGTSMLLLPFNDVRRGEAAAVIHVPYASPFQIPWARLPAITPGKTLGAGSHDFQTLFAWLTDERDILGSACVSSDFQRDRGVSIATFRSPLHRALALSWDLAVIQSQMAADLKSEPERGKLLLLHHVVDGLLKSGKGDQFIDKHAFEQDRSHLRSFETLQEAIDRRGKLLADHLDGKAFGEIIGDMNAAGGEAYGRFMDTLAPVYDVLPSTPRGDHHLKAFFDGSQGLLTSKTYKAARKSAKAIWAFFKAAIKVATDPKLKPLRAPLVEWASHLSLEVRVDEHGLIHAKLMKGFETAVVDHDLAHKAFILIDAYNLIVAFKDLEKEWKTSGLKSPKAFSAAAATFSLIGTSAGWRESVLRKLGNTEAERMWKGAKNIVGVAGNVADAVGSSWQAYKEFELADTNAGVAQVVCAAGAGTQVAGYALALLGVAGAPVVLMVGAIAAVGGTIFYILAENDDIENWMNHCWWGLARNEKTSGTTKWSEGRLELFHKDLDKQLRALNVVFFDFALTWDYLPIDPVFKREQRALILRATFSHLPDGARLIIRLVGRSGGVDHELRPEGVWNSARSERDVQGQILEMSEELHVFQFDELVCEGRLDIYGDGMQLLPPAAQEPRRARFRVPLIEHVMDRNVPTSA